MKNHILIIFILLFNVIKVNAVNYYRVLSGNVNGIYWQGNFTINDDKSGILDLYTIGIKEGELEAYNNLLKIGLGYHYIDKFISLDGTNFKRVEGYNTNYNIVDNFKFIQFNDFNKYDIVISSDKWQKDILSCTLMTKFNNFKIFNPYDNETNINDVNNLDRDILRIDNVLSFNESLFFDLFHDILNKNYFEGKSFTTKYYLRNYDSNYKNYANNEFELKRVENLYKSSIDIFKNNLVKNLGTLIIDKDVQIGNYNFENKFFPIYDFNNEDVVYNLNKVSLTGDLRQSVWLMNSYDFSNLYLDEISAEEVLNHSFGDSFSNRRYIKLRIHFILLPFSLNKWHSGVNDPAYSGEGWELNDLIGYIKKIELLKPYNKSYFVFNTIQPKMKINENDLFIKKIN